MAVKVKAPGGGRRRPVAARWSRLLPGGRGRSQGLQSGVAAGSAGEVRFLLRAWRGGAPRARGASASREARPGRRLRPLRAGAAWQPQAARDGTPETRRGGGEGLRLCCCAERCGSCPRDGRWTGGECVCYIKGCSTWTPRVKRGAAVSGRRGSREKPYSARVLTPRTSQARGRVAVVSKSGCLYGQALRGRGTNQGVERHRDRLDPTSRVVLGAARGEDRDGRAVGAAPSATRYGEQGVGSPRARKGGGRTKTGGGRDAGRSEMRATRRPPGAVREAVSLWSVSAR